MRCKYTLVDLYLERYRKYQPLDFHTGIMYYIYIYTYIYICIFQNELHIKLSIAMWMDLKLFQGLVWLLMQELVISSESCERWGHQSGDLQSIVELIWPKFNHNFKKR